MHTSNFRKVKRIEDVIQVFAIVNKKIASKLLMIGDGDERVAAEKLCRDLHLCDDVRFLGKQDAIEEILSVCDLFIMPSESESFGLAALEAMACQVPVISSNAGGMPELNINGITGYMSNVGDVEDMASNALRILSDDLTLNTFKHQALKRAAEFDISIILPKYENYYRQIIQSANNNLGKKLDPVSIS